MNLRMIALTTLCLAVAFPALGQGPRNPRRGFGPSADTFHSERTGAGVRMRIDRLEAALDLTPSQVASAETLFEQCRATREGFQGQARSSREGLRAAMESNDPTAIGNAVLAERELRGQLRAIDEQCMVDFKSLLTLNQQETLDSIEAFGGRFVGRGGAHREGRGGIRPAPGVAQ